MAYKCCAVPQCTNTSENTPEKVFVNVPNTPSIQKRWMKLARRNPNSISANSVIYMCEDHFEVEKDVANYTQYKMGYSRRLLLTEGAFPTKFDCQQDNRNVGNQNYCWGCFHTNDKMNEQYNIQTQALKDIFKVDSISVCNVCRQVADQAERFILNIQSNQIVRENSQDNISLDKRCRPPVLARMRLPSIYLLGAGDEECCTVLSSLVKMEVDSNQLDDDDNHDFDETFVKEEVASQDIQPKEEFPSHIDCASKSLKNVPKINLKVVKKKVININKSSKQRKIILVKKSMSANKGQHEAEYTLIHVTEKQCMQERELRSQDSYYQSSVFRCEDCVKGYMIKASYDRHMEFHSLSRGDFVCQICIQRFESARKLAAHNKCHTYRYKCMKCDVVRVSHDAIRRHYATKHSHGSSLFQCTECPKVFKNKVSLRKHETTSHSGNARVACDVCQRTFISKDTLLNHILRKHPAEGASVAYRKRHACPDCGLLFAAPYLLRNHAAAHSDSRPHYCVECDRSFKTAIILARHLKTASRHVFNADLRVACDSCEKRFACRRDLDRHVNSVHLNVRPHACDKCDRAYLNSWSLREHKMYSHEGFKKERRYPCTLCDKEFDRSSILKSHIRTHTGERPYHCKHCPSQFVQSSQLRTHTNLVHLKLTRDGKPKQSAVK